MTRTGFRAFGVESIGEWVASARKLIRPALVSCAPTWPMRTAAAGCTMRLPRVALALSISLSFLVAPPPGAYAASIIRVTPSGATTGTCGGDWTTTPCDLLYALNSVAVSGDELWVAAGVYKPTTVATDRDASIVLKAGVAVYGGFAGGETAREERNPQTNVTIFSGDIDGDDIPSPIVTDASTATGLGNNSYHVVTGAAGATLDGVTITAGYSPNLWQAGGGLFTDGSMTIYNVTFSGNWAFTGGGLYGAAAVTITNSTFTGNWADDKGGGIYGGGGTTLTNLTFTKNRATDGAGAAGNGLTLTSVTFTDNSASMRGGGFYVAGGTATLTDVTFTHNRGGSGGIGGGMTIEGNSLVPVTLNRVTFTDNYGATTGGGLGAWTGNVVLNDVTFSGNSASDGGAIGVADYGGNWTLNNVLITGNSAGVGGGITTTATMTLNNVSLVDNYGGDYGGGIVSLTATTINNSIIWGNVSPPPYGSYYNICYLPGYCVVPTLNYTDVEGDYNVAGTTNISVNPLLQPLGNNGGGIQTRALPPNSPVIDAGDSSTCTLTDERGEVRNDLRCDMGAFERKYSDGNVVQKSALAKDTTYGFGPALGKISRDITGDPGTITFTKGPWATQPSNAVTRTWEISATNGTYNLTVSLCVTDSERNGLDRDSLHLWRYNGASWEDKGGTPDLPGVLPWKADATTTCVSAQNITALSQWTLATGDPSGGPACVGNSAICDDGNPCTEDTCDPVNGDPSTGCVTTPLDGQGTTTCGVGECQRTVANCVNGVPQTCKPGPSSPEVCNGLDDDCDGAVDNVESRPTTCGTGSCASTGSTSCVNGTEVDSCDPHTTDNNSCNASHSAISDCKVPDTCQAGVCQDNGYTAAGAACGDPSSSACDQADTCGDHNGVCNPNHAAATTTCGDADGPCTNQDYCDGTGACADKGFKSAATACGNPSSGPCDNPDHCSGVDGTCVPNHVADDTPCAAGGDGPVPHNGAVECKEPDTCQAGVCQDNGYAAVGTPCGDPSSSACDQPDSCGDHNGVCNPNHVADSAPCGTPGVCEVQDTCQGGVCNDNGLAAAGTPCGDPSSSACDQPDSCGDYNGVCNTNYASVTLDKQVCAVQSTGCTSYAQAVRLEYTGSPITSPLTVTVKSSNGRTVTYQNFSGSLVTGTVLTCPPPASPPAGTPSYDCGVGGNENDFTIDATAGGCTTCKLGGTVAVFLNSSSTPQETFNTACRCANPSFNLVVGNAMCLSSGQGSSQWRLAALRDPAYGVVDPDACSQNFPPPPSQTGGPCGVDKNKITELDFVYVGAQGQTANCANQQNSQPASKRPCTGTAMDRAPVNLQVTDGGGGVTFFGRPPSGPYNVSPATPNTFTVRSADGRKTSDGTAAPKAQFPGDLHIKVYAPTTGKVIEDQRLKSDCSQAINVGDVFGGFKVTRIASTKGGVYEGDQNCINVEYRYAVTNNGSSDATGLYLCDDHLGQIGGPFSVDAMTATKFPPENTCVPAGTKNTAAVQSVPCSPTLDPATSCALDTAKLPPGPCVLGYPDGSNGTLSQTVFNESEVLRALRPTGTTGPGQMIQAFYNDEHALTLGISKVGTTPYPVTTSPWPPACVDHPSVGTTALTGAQAGTDLAGRPMWPALFITDITMNASSRLCDWQQASSLNNPQPGCESQFAVVPSSVCGVWKAASKTTTAVTPDGDPVKNNWDLGTGAPPSGPDPVPTGAINQGYGAEVRWNVDELGLQCGHTYRLQFLVHDGDQTKTGGDVGQACMNVDTQCP
jgi:hypothetical protein